MNKIYYISDYFLSDIIGGGELNDYELCCELEKRSYRVNKIRSNQLNMNMLDQTSIYIISNFINLNQQVKDYITNNCKYVIYEHDHKYLRSRNPALFKEYKAPKEEIVNEKFSDLDNIVIYNTIKNIGYKKIQNKHVNNDNHLLATETTLHTAIHLACYMGAKNIILVGHDCTTILGEPNFEGYHTDKSYRIKHKNGKKTYSEWIGRLWVRTRELKKVLKCKFDVNLVSINPFPSLKQLGEFIEK